MRTLTTITEVITSKSAKLLNDRYQIIKPLSVGAFAETYLAKDIHNPDRPQCVIKQFKCANQKLFLFEQRLLINEAEILKKLGHHDGIPQLLGNFAEEQKFYLVQEFIDGQLLSSQLPISKRCRKRWSEEQVIQLLTEVLLILEFIHSQGVIHCDLKPDNLIRRATDGKFVLIDFGLAQLSPPSLPIFSQKIDQIRDRICEIGDADVVDPLGYIPREQFIGQPYPNSDIYALGMIAIQALTGLTPGNLKADPQSGEVNWQQFTCVSDRLTSVINQMVHFNWENRYQSATEVLHSLQQRATEQGLPLTIQQSVFSSSSTSLPIFFPLLLEFPSIEVGKSRVAPLTITTVFHSGTPLSLWSDITPLLLPTFNQKLLNISAPSRVFPTLMLENQIVERNEISLTVTDSTTVIEDQAASTTTHKSIFSIPVSPSTAIILTGISVGFTANAVAIAVGVSSLFQVGPPDYGPEILARATTQFQTGHFHQAIALVQSISTDSAVYQQSQTTKQHWQTDWLTANNQFHAVEKAIQQERWLDVLKEADKVPNIAFWQEKLHPIVQQSKPKIEAEAEKFIQKAYQCALVRDFTNALSFLEQIPPGTTAYAIIQPKITEYRQKQSIKAHRLIQAAYAKAAIGNFTEALKLLESLPKGMANYDKITAKIAEYREKQSIKAHPLIQAAYAQAAVGNFTEALKLLESLPAGMASYDKVKAKIAQYRHQQRFQAHFLVQQAYAQVEVGNFSGALKSLAKISPGTPGYEKVQAKIANYRQKTRMNSN